MTPLSTRAFAAHWRSWAVPAGIALTCLALERFLRIILGSEATDADTLHNLLEKATCQRLNLLTLPCDDRQDGIRRIVAVRNTLLHGNYEQAARNE